MRQAAGDAGAGGAGVASGGQDPPGDERDTSDDVVGPLTDILQKLSIAVDPTNTSDKLKGMVYKPEYPVQHVKQGLQLKQIDHSRLTYRELVYGWFCVIQHLSKAGGDVEAYVAHCKYVSSLAMLSQFTDAAYVGYDRHVMTQVIDGDADTFVAGDTLAVASHFHAGNVLPKNIAQKIFKQDGSFKWNKSQPTENQSDLCQRVFQMMCATLITIRVVLGNVLSNMFVLAVVVAIEPLAAMRRTKWFLID